MANADGGVAGDGGEGGTGGAVGGTGAGTVGGAGATGGKVCPLRKKGSRALTMFAHAS